MGKGGPQTGALSLRFRATSVVTIIAKIQRTLTTSRPKRWPKHVPPNLSFHSHREALREDQPELGFFFFFLFPYEETKPQRVVGIGPLVRAEPGFELRQHGLCLPCVLPFRVRWPLRISKLWAAVLLGWGLEDRAGDWRPPPPHLRTQGLRCGVPGFAS